MDALGHQRFAVVGHDTGFAIGYALAADHPDRVERVVLAEIPGLRASRLAARCSSPRRSTTGSGTCLQPARRSCNEQLVTGREDIFFGYGVRASAGQEAARRRRSSTTSAPLSKPDALRGSFGFYRALDATLAQNEERKTRRLTMPVLAIGGAESFGDHGRRTR